MHFSYFAPFCCIVHDTLLCKIVTCLKLAQKLYIMTISKYSICTFCKIYNVTAEYGIFDPLPQLYNISVFLIVQVKHIQYEIGHFSGNRKKFILWIFQISSRQKQEMCCFISHPSILLFYCSHQKKIIITLVSFNSVFVLVRCLLCPINKCATFNSLNCIKFNIYIFNIKYFIFLIV